MKTILLILTAAGLALAEDKKIPDVPKLELTEMKLEAEKAKATYWQIEAIKAQFTQLLEEQQRSQARFEVKRDAVFSKAGAKREEYELDAEKGVFVKKPAENAKK